jgi:nucleotide-binding universal stress UspA family protein
MAFPPRRILLATDFSPGAEKAGDAAVALAKAFTAELGLVHVVTLPSYVETSLSVVGAGVASVDLGAVIAKRVEQSMAKESRRLEALGRKPAWLHVEEGPPAQLVTVRAQESGYDLVVCGTHGRSGVAHAILGSVAEGVVRRSPVPVLTVRGG